MFRPRESLINKHKNLDTLGYEYILAQKRKFKSVKLGLFRIKMGFATQI